MQHKRKMLAPILVAALMIAYYALYFGFLLWALPGIWKYLLGIFPAALSILTIAVCVERIKEIQRGEEDDLSQY